MLLVRCHQGIVMRSRMAMQKTWRRREESLTTTMARRTLHSSTTCCNYNDSTTTTWRLPQQQQQRGFSARGFASQSRRRRLVRRCRPQRSMALPKEEESFHHHHHHPRHRNAVSCSVRDMDDVSLSTLGSQENHVQALEEMLKRHIMHVDGVDYSTACRRFEKIEIKNHEYEHAMALPFQMGILACATAGFLSIPLVFHLPTVEFFNTHFVTAEHPQPKELETALEVGSWSWNWMVRTCI